MNRQSDALDIYHSDLAGAQLDHDRQDYRQSLYTNVKPDHPVNPRTDGPCNCEHGDDDWERSGIAMCVQWPQPGTARAQGSGEVADAGPR